MHALLLDYHDNRRRIGRIDAVLLAVGLIALAASLIVGVSVFSRINLLEAQQAVSSRDTAAETSNRSSEIELHHLNSELKQANSVAGLLSLPWDDLFSDIEASQDSKVALLAIEPDAGKRTLMITAEAKDFDAMLSYVRLLQTRASMKDIYLKSHHIETKSAEMPVRFVLVASWVQQS